MPQRRVGPWTPEDIETLKQMVADDKSKATISVRLGRSIQGIEREAAKHGLKLKARKRPISYRELDRQRTTVK